MKDRKNGKDRASLTEMINKRLDIDASFVVRGFSAELYGRYRAELCGVKKILSYTDNHMIFNTTEGEFYVMGKRLFCSSFKRNVIIIEGEIITMSFDGKEN